MARLTTLRPTVRTLDQRTAKEPAKAADPFYLSAAWRGLVADVTAQRPKRCERCNATGRRLVVDHIVEMRDGGEALDPRNCQLLCWPCHTRKTNEARAARQARRFDGEGGA